MKKLFIFLTLFILSTVAAYAGTFPDVDSEHENYNAIEYLFDHDVIHGYESGDFGPEDPVNRAAAIKIIAGAFGVAFDGEYEILFPDVIKEDWFFPYVMGGHAANVIDGYPEGDFRPDNTVNLAETLKMMVIAADSALPLEVNEQVFGDVPQNEWYSFHAYYARENNILMADDYGMVYPDQPMTRAAFSEVIYRLMFVEGNDGEAFPLDLSWPTHSSSYLPFKMKYDDSWELIENDEDTVFFKANPEYPSSTYTRIYPNSAVINVSWDENDEALTKGEYFTKLIEVFEGSNFTEFVLDNRNTLEVLSPTAHTVDWYMYLDDGTVLAFYTEYGDGVLAFQFKKIIAAMLATIEFKEVSLQNYDELLSNILANLLVEGTGMELLNQVSDKIIIETDTIGVGTGPVDYYYSEGMDRTFKYERASNVILDTREGETSTF